MGLGYRFVDHFVGRSAACGLVTRWSRFQASMSLPMTSAWLPSFRSRFQRVSRSQYTEAAPLVTDLESSDVAVQMSLEAAREASEERGLEQAPIARRNFGIAAHIDSGKTTLSERILFYAGRIRKIHEVRGKDGVGATMDSMELERERGITIASAATYLNWQRGFHLNLIDTPGHVDFTIEVERAMRVLDGAILVLCGVSGVQSQSLTVDRQMRRYRVPRLTFVNKLDRQGANPERVLQQLMEKLHQPAAFLTFPIGLERDLCGVVDVIRQQAIYFDGGYGEQLRIEDNLPSSLQHKAEQARRLLIERLANVDERFGDLFIEQEYRVPDEEIHRAVRRATIARSFTPVFCGSALRNIGVQPLLDAVVSYLPSPVEVRSFAMQGEAEQRIPLEPDAGAPLVSLAFKLEDGRFGQLTYVRVYQGTLRRGETVYNVRTGKRLRVPRLVRLHADQMEDIQEAAAGDICAMFGLDCASGDTFTDERGLEKRLTLESIRVPEPVISLAISPQGKGDGQTNFTKALNRFTKEDPTFRTYLDPESKQTIISGMGELHLEIYVERMRREYGIDCQVGQPKVNYRESISRRAPFQYLHRKQSGGAGQYAGVEGYIEPTVEGGFWTARADDLETPATSAGDEMATKTNESAESSARALVAHREAAKRAAENEFVNALVGNNVPPQFVPAIERGFQDAVQEGALSGHRVQGVRMVLQDGKSHPVDSNEIAFRTAALMAFRKAFALAGGVVLEPWMRVSVQVPQEYSGDALGSLTKRRGVVVNSQTDGEYAVIDADVPLSQMFGYSTDLRSMTQGKGEFTMEYLRHEPCVKEDYERLVAAYAAHRKADT
ncbi:elongation factor EF-G [Cyanidiococcus yangmingshanensis]|uniref:Elongation factor G, mitochondrial n=1 Tax=Cyanidiococcus yangmingshanensis TaxID=2690220 RepID=A0A7J7ICH4_9RHOD|nr:elongation factor EF-G [Cyanidiococcus yangmingshanensis]